MNLWKRALKRLVDVMTYAGFRGKGVEAQPIPNEASIKDQVAIMADEIFVFNRPRGFSKKDDTPVTRRRRRPRNRHKARPQTERTN